MRDDEKKIKAVPELSISADERPERRQPRGTAKKNAGSEIPKTVGKGGNGMSWFLLVLVAAMGGAGAWQFHEVQQELKDTRAQLHSAEDNLNQVTGKVSATGETLNQSDSSLRSELKEVNSEIRKLWDVSNKRNRQWILINKDNVVKATKKADDATEKANRAAENADKANKAIAGLSKEVKDSGQILKAMSSEQVAAQSEVTINMQAMRKQLEALQTQLAQQKKRNAELEQNIKDQSDAVKSMDNFRQQINRQILQLEGTVREFTQPPEQGLGLE